MAARLRWHPLARRDLLEIYETIGRDNPAAAERIYDSIEAKTGLLADFPRLGPRRPEFGPTARILIVQRYVVLYEIRSGTNQRSASEVRIVRVVDGRRDLPRLFGASTG
jgi:toxin ParE1/3/4